MGRIRARSNVMLLNGLVCVCAALEHIKQSHSERDQRETEIAALKARIEELNSAIVVCQEKMPISGAPVTRQV